MSTLVIGGGHNGLAAAASLARAGRQVTLLERRDLLGGICAGEPFHPGYRHAGLLHDACQLPGWVIDALGLADHGLRLRQPCAVQVVGGQSFPDQLDANDVVGWASMQQQVDQLRPFVAQLLASPAPRIDVEAELWPLAKTALGLRRLGADEMMRLLRAAPTCVDDWVSEHLTAPWARAAACLRGSAGSWMGPRSPTSTALWLLNEAQSGQAVQGGPAALVSALEGACRAAGVRLRTGAGVRRILVEAGTVRGVVLDDGSELAAEQVVSAIGPRRTLLDAVDPLQLDYAVARDLSDVRLRGTLAKLHIALRGPPRLEGQAHTLERVLFGASTPLDLERSFDHAKHRRLPDRATLDVRVVSVADPGLAPEGHHVMSVVVHGVPYQLDAGWGDEARDSLRQVVLAQLSEALPGIFDQIVSVETLTPADLEARYGLEGGHVWHGELALDQLWSMRPTAALSGHHTPIAGLFLGSSGVHPGGALSCAPGLLAARVALAGS